MHHNGAVISRYIIKPVNRNGTFWFDHVILADMTFNVYREKKFTSLHIQKLTHQYHFFICWSH